MLSNYEKLNVSDSNWLFFRPITTRRYVLLRLFHKRLEKKMKPLWKLSCFYQCLIFLSTQPTVVPALRSTQSQTYAPEFGSQYDAKFASFSENERLELRDKAKEMFQFGYDNYMQHAYPKDELDPIHCAGRGHDTNDP